MLAKQTLGPSNRNNIVAENVFQRSFQIYQPNIQPNKDGLKWETEMGRRRKPRNKATLGELYSEKNIGSGYWTQNWLEENEPENDQVFEGIILW